jgi:hypothetical protein
MNAKAVFDEIAMRFREELDYVLEADRHERFRKIHAGDPSSPGLAPSGGRASWCRIALAELAASPGRAGRPRHPHRP